MGGFGDSWEYYYVCRVGIVIVILRKFLYGYGFFMVFFIGVGWGT